MNYTMLVAILQRINMEILAWIIAFTIAITIHEAAHAWMADRLGDPTPRLMGRLSLNPIVHYDPVGTTLLLFLVIIGSPFPFGWAKPVQFDPFNLKNPRRDSMLISLAGPASNIILAVILAIVLHVLTLPALATLIVVTTISLNVILAFFNLLPIHPLDGGKIFVGLLPEREAHEADEFLHRYGMIILFFLIFPWNGQSPVSAVLSPVIRTVIAILIP